MALVDGQVAAAMARTVAADGVDFEITPFRPLTPGEQQRLARTARAYGAFLDRPGDPVHCPLTWAGPGQRTMNGAEPRAQPAIQPIAWIRRYVR